MKVRMIEVPPVPVKPHYIVTLELTETERWYLSCMTNATPRSQITDVTFGSDLQAKRDAASLLAAIHRVVAK